MKLLLTAETAAGRLDAYVASHIDELSRSRAAKLISEKKILINGIPGQAKSKLRPGDVVEVYIDPPKEIGTKAEDIPLDIVYEDDCLAVINKPQGMVVHPAAGNESGTLVNALLFCMDGLSGINGEIRPGIVHRLDKDTSGLLVVAKNDAAHVSLAGQIKEKTAHRIYMALVCGNPKQDEFTVNAAIARHRTDRKRMAVDVNGRRAVTHFTVIERFPGYCLLKCRLETGRTHQIRVHLAHICHSVAGDPVYSRQKTPFKTEGQLLHACELSFDHPATGERMTFYAPLPEHFCEALSYLREKC